MANPSTVAQTPLTLVLIHGYLAGMEASLNALSGMVSYFNQVPQLLRQPGVSVVVPRLPGQATVQQRANALAAQLHAIPRAVGASQGRDLCLIAHSMGGLDARLLLSQDATLARRVHSLVTLGTPFLGSPVADALLHTPHKVPLPLRSVVQQLLLPLGPGLADLSVARATALSQSCADAPGVHRLSIAAQPQSWWPASPFALLANSSLFAGQANDGLVSYASAHWHSFSALPDWPVDHAGLLGWGWMSYSEHRQRYLCLLQHVRGLPALQA